MNTKFETFDLWRDDSLEDDRPFIIACRENINEEWILTSLSEEEAKQLYEYLQQYFK